MKIIFAIFIISATMMYIYIMMLMLSVDDDYDTVDDDYDVLAHHK